MADTGDESQLTPALALHIVQRMGEAGQPPEQGIRHINVGNETYLRILEQEYLDRLLVSSRGSSFKLVQGFYGGGKTHFLFCVRDLAWSKGFITSLVNLSPSECPYDDPVKVYRAVATRVCLPPDVEGMEPVTSFPEILRRQVDERLESLGRDRFLLWLQKSLGRKPVDSHSFRRAAIELMTAYVTGQYDKEQVMEAWLRGEPVPRQETRAFGVYDSIERSNGFSMLRSLCQLVVALDYPGTVLMFDEVDRNLSLDRRKIQIIGDNLRQVIDLCGRSMLPGVLFLYAAPPVFMETVVPDYPALSQRLKNPVPLSERSPQAPVIDLEKLDLEPEPLLRSIGEHLIDTFEVAHGLRLTPPIQAGNLINFAKAAATYSLEVGHRRLFVKCYLDFLGSQVLDGEVEISLQDAEQLLRSGTLVEEDDYADY